MHYSQPRRRIIPPPSGRQAFSNCRALVLVDSVQIKKTEQEKCRNLYKKIEAARSKVSLHETRSMPEYQKWLNSQFGKELTEIRELTQKVQSMSEIVNRVYAEADMTGDSKRKIYERLMRGKSKIEEIHREYESRKEPGGEHSRSDENAFKEDLMRATFEMLFGERKHWKYEDCSYEEAFENFKEDINQKDRS